MRIFLCLPFAPSFRAFLSRLPFAPPRIIAINMLLLRGGVRHYRKIAFRNK